MSIQKYFGIVVLLCGIGLLVLSAYIKNEVASGRMQIRSAQQTVDTANTLFSQSSKTKQIGKQLTTPIQDQINEGSEKASYYENMAHFSLVGGVVLLILGVGILVIRRR